MNCHHFEAKLDEYLDGALEAADWSAASEHAGTCGACDALVTGYQQASALLRAAVTDKVAAVDVSGLWDAIDGQLRNAAAAPGAALADFRVAARSGGVDIGWLARARDWAAVTVESIGFPAGWRSAQHAGAALMTAAVAVAVVWASIGGQSTAPERMARAKSKAVRIEALEVPSGYMVSTWARPRSRTRMIAINPTPGYAVASVAYTGD